MRLHVTLKIEVAELIVLLELKKGRQLGVGLNNATVLLVLQIVSANIGIDLLAHLSSGHLSSSALTKKLGELVADTSGLNESRRLTVTSTLGSLSRGLLCSLQLAGNELLKGLEIALHGREDASNLLELSTKLVELLGNGR